MACCAAAGVAGVVELAVAVVVPVADAMATLPGFPSSEAGPDSCCGGQSTPEGTKRLVRGKTICSCPVVVVHAVAPPFAMAQN